MKKSIITLAALATLATSAMAQSNVQIYGTADAGLGYSKSDRTDNVNKRTGVVGGMLQMNKIGFRGTEDLGNGNKALFQIEMGYDLGQSTGLNTARESFVGLDTGKTGTVRVGRLETLDSVAATKFDAMGASAFSAIGSVIGRETFANSAIDYSITAAPGLTLAAQYAFDGSTANAAIAHGNGTEQERGYELAAIYETGPLAVGYVFGRTTNYARVTDDNRRLHVLGASYDFQVAKAYGEYVNAKSDLANTLDTRVYVLGIKVPVATKTYVDASFARADDKLTDGRANIYGLQLVHNLSKRTAVYTGYQHVSNDKTSYAALNTSGVPVQGTGNGINSTGFGAGMKVSF